MQEHNVQQHEKANSAESAGPESQNMRGLPPPAFQLKASGADAPGSMPPVQRKANNTGLPDNLKSGVEATSGMSMDDVNVHYNSDKPAGVNALAYAQGTDIHVGPGQEQHLPHEAWHVVQQKQGRVNATTSVNNAPVNDDKGLETEADVMGAKALQAKADPTKQLQTAENAAGSMQLMSSVIQREPIARQAGTIQAFIEVFNNTPSRMGTLVGAAAKAAMLRLAETEMEFPNPVPRPSVTPYFNERDARYIYTSNGGWIDMVHFLFYAGKAFKYKMEKQAAQESLDEIARMPWYLRGFVDAEYQNALYRTAGQSPQGEAMQDGYLQERSDSMFAKHSAYSYEDLPSDNAGARFAVDYFNPSARSNFGQQLQTYFIGVLGATTPQSAPNFANLPTTTPETPSRTNRTTTPVYTSANP